MRQSRLGLGRFLLLGIKIFLPFWKRNREMFEMIVLIKNRFPIGYNSLIFGERPSANQDNADAAVWYRIAKVEGRVGRRIERGREGGKGLIREGDSS